MKKILAALILAGALLASGCASVPMASMQADQQAKKFETTAGKSNIYVYRNETFGAAIKMPVFIDDKVVGQTAADTYILATVDPGKHKVVSQSAEDASLDITTEPGKNYFIWQEVKMGVLSASSDLHLQNEAQGKAGVMECKRVE